jgi:hypothetical protein
MWSHVIFFLSFLGILRISDNSCKRVLFLRFGLGLISQKRIFLCSWIYVIHVFIPLSNTWASFSRLWRNTDASLIAYNYIYFSNKAGFFFFFPIWTQGLARARKDFYFLSHSSSPFCFTYFSYRALHYALVGLDYNPPIWVSHVAGMTGMYHHAQLLLVEVGLSNFFAWASFEPWSSWSLPPQ